MISLTRYFVEADGFMLYLPCHSAMEIYVHHQPKSTSLVMAFDTGTRNPHRFLIDTPVNHPLMEIPRVAFIGVGRC